MRGAANCMTTNRVITGPWSAKKQRNRVVDLTWLAEFRKINGMALPPKAEATPINRRRIDR